MPIHPLNNRWLLAAVACWPWMGVMASDSPGGEAPELLRALSLSELANRLPGAYVQRLGDGPLFLQRVTPTPTNYVLPAEDGPAARPAGAFGLRQLQPGKADARFEAWVGGWGYHSEAAAGSAGGDDWGVSGDFRNSHQDGWRQDTGYDKQTLNVRADKRLTQGALVAKFSYVKVDSQQSAPNRLAEADYLRDPQRNYYPDVHARREAYAGSLSYEGKVGDTVVTLTPFIRTSAADSVQSTTFVDKPRQELNDTTTYGVQSQATKALGGAWNTQVQAGVNYEVMEGHRIVTPLTVTSVLLPNSFKQFTSWYVTPNVGNYYDYTVQYRTTSPFGQVEFSPLPDLRLLAGVRYDDTRVDYHNNMAPFVSKTIVRPESVALAYSRVSPRLGATYRLAPAATLFATYTEGFRAPDDASMFRPGASQASTGLKPTVAANTEIGLRGATTVVAAYSVSAYRTMLRNEVLPQKTEQSTVTMSPGNADTLHTGVEALVVSKPLAGWSVAAAWAYGTHTYRNWVTDLKGGTSYSGNEMEGLPRTMGAVAVNYAPGLLNGGKLTAEVIHLGSAWGDTANTWKYAGHDLLNLRGSYRLGQHVEVLARVDNVLDARYSTVYAGTAARKQLEPGMPRTAYLGVSVSY